QGWPEARQGAEGEASDAEHRHRRLALRRHGGRSAAGDRVPGRGGGGGGQEEMTRLGLTDAADRKLKGGMRHAKALKEKHPTLSIATAAWLSGATQADLRKEPAF